MKIYFVLAFSVLMGKVDVLLSYLRMPDRSTIPRSRNVEISRQAWK